MQRSTGCCLLALFAVLSLAPALLAGDAPSKATKEGISERVLHPWTPLRIEQKDTHLRVGAWGRAYDFDGQPFPVRITNQGREMLASVVSVRATTGGRDVTWNAGRLRLVSETPASAVLDAEADSSDGAVTLGARMTVEYDGMLRVDWQLTPRRRLALDALSVEIPLQARCAKYYNWAYNSVARAASQPQFGFLPDEGFTSGYVPFVWLGDEDIGVNWWCESPQNWLNAQPGEALRIRREGDRVILRIQLVSRPTTLEPGADGGTGALRYTFGLMATPARPLTRDGFDLRLVTAPAYGRDYTVATDAFGGKLQLDVLQALGVRTLMLFNWTGILGHVAPAGREDDLRRTVRACHERGIRVIVYLGSFMSESAPEWAELGQRIPVVPENRFGDKYPDMPMQYVHMACNRSEFQDFIVNGVAKLMDDYDVDGVYLDGIGGAWYCGNREHGCGYRDADGSVGKTFPLFAAREIVRRLYTVIKMRKPDGVLFVHQSSQMLMPVSAWCDMIWDGEQFGEGGRFPLDVLPLDTFRAEFLGRQLGVPVDFIFYTAFRPSEQSARAWQDAYRKSCGLTLLHDTLSCATGMNDPGVSFPMIELEASLWRVMDSFARKEATWLPYWANDGLVAAAPADVRVSLYHHPQNGVLAVVMNCGRDPVAAEVRLKSSALGLDERSAARDALSDEFVPMTGFVVHTPLESLGWRLLRIR